MTLTIPPKAAEIARAAARRESRSLSNYTARVYELAGRIRLADLERLAEARMQSSPGLEVA